MNPISFRKSAVIFSIILFTAYGAILACVDYFEGYDYDSDFTPEVYVDQSYAPLFYAPWELFYGGGDPQDPNTRFSDMLVPEWKTWLGNALTTDQIQFLLLDKEAVPVIEEAYTSLGKQKSLPGKPYLVLTDTKIKSFIEFLHYAKIIEKSSTVEEGSWNYESTNLPGVAADIRQAVKGKYESTTDVFLKNRYWFQTLKAYFYSTEKGSLPGFFEQTQGAAPKNTLYYRGLGYTAGAYYVKKEYSKSNYAYSLVFDKCPQLRTSSAFNFHPQEENDFKGTLALAKTPKEKASVWALFGYYADEKRAIQEIYALDPASEHLSFLLTRFINKQEASLNRLTFSSQEAFKTTIKKSLDQDAVSLVSSIARDGKTAQPYLWNMAAGFLAALNGNHIEADKLFAKSEKGGAVSELASKQLRLLRLINLLYSLPEIDEKSQTKVMAELHWLYHTSDSEDGFRKYHAVNWSKQYIAQLYTFKQDVVLAELFFHEQAFYQNQSNLDKMKAFLLKPAKSEWEKFAVGLYSLSLDDVFEYEAVMYTYAGNLDGAIAAMEKSQERQSVELMGNPFNGKIKDCHDCDHIATQRVKYTKLSFLKKMKEMQALVDQKQDVYNNALLLGNAYYNITYFGNARMFYYGDVMNEFGNIIAPYYQPYLFGCDRAKKYYSLALSAATTDEQKAKCEYMLAKCERNDFYAKEYHMNDEFYGEPDVAFKEWNGFKNLRDKYANTKYYQDVIQECGYFKKYISE